ncbi:hypothetical protein B0H14DRAFT_3434286 [Mycena olivaceomarginata]|nr:hypothetical protein B0H14DRAFT_3434286 [Mycena olivaceomarginata]
MAVPQLLGEQDIKDNKTVEDELHMYLAKGWIQLPDFWLPHSAQSSDLSSVPGSLTGSPVATPPAGTEGWPPSAMSGIEDADHLDLLTFPDTDTKMTDPVNPELDSVRIGEVPANTDIDSNSGIKNIQSGTKSELAVEVPSHTSFTQALAQDSISAATWRHLAFDPVVDQDNKIIKVVLIDLFKPATSLYQAFIFLFLFLFLFLGGVFIFIFFILFVGWGWGQTRGCRRKQCQWGSTLLRKYVTTEYPTVLEIRQASSPDGLQMLHTVAQLEKWVIQVYAILKDQMHLPIDEETGIAGHHKISYPNLGSLFLQGNSWISSALKGRLFLKDHGNKAPVIAFLLRTRCLFGPDAFIRELLKLNPAA